ncbi:MAG: hypothetical protein DI586_09190 [Micavibrio aeruginosavorus]|uniref:Hydroxyacid dehydrogenase n=1 Tax=Micavibrio aeruginosavorus TaxID=349221 RepID=A0A2W5H9A6_9BACT|nr:MAG: hypothetical protein DI586_09190 [Micavibrio aeruginosavorus]
MKKTILALGALLPPEMKEVEKNFNLLKLWKQADPEEALKTHKNDIVGILSTAGGMAVTRRMIDGLPNLELIAQFGVGVDNIDLAAAAERHVAVTNTPDVVTNDTADTALALILATLRRIVEADVTVRTGGWRPFPLGSTLTGKTVGIIGLGRIGQAIAKRCERFEMKIAYHGRSEKKGAAYQYYADLIQMAENVDVLVAACPGGEKTRHIVGRKVLKALGPNGFLINISRGSVVHTEDLLIALSNREIAGAGLDVYENEPEVPEALKSMDNVVLLPHIGTATHETRTVMGQLVLANIVAHFEGKALVTPVTIS